MDKQEIYHSPAANISPWNRTLCSVLEEMLQCHEKSNHHLLQSLVEEAQTYANRMEAKLSDVKEYNSLKDRYKKLKEAVDKLEEKEARLSASSGDLSSV